MIQWKYKRQKSICQYKPECVPSLKSGPTRTNLRLNIQAFREAETYYSYRPQHRAGQKD